VTTLSLGPAEMDDIAALIETVLTSTQPAEGLGGKPSRARYQLDETVAAKVAGQAAAISSGSSNSAPRRSPPKKPEPTSNNRLREPTMDLSTATWRKSSRSSGGGQGCVEPSQGPSLSTEDR
jgi:hypothetical protein